MFKKLLTLFYGLCLCLSLSAQGNFTMKGHLTDLPDGNLTVSYLAVPGSGDYVDVHTTVENGQFAFSVNLDYAVSARIGEDFYFTMVPGEEAYFEGTTQDYTSSGSKYYQDLEKINEMRKPYLRQQQEITERYEDMGNDREILEEMRNEEMRAINEEKGKVYMEYIKQHADEDASVELVIYLNLKDILEAVELLSPSVREGRMKSLIDSDVNIAQMILKRGGN